MRVTLGWEEVETACSLLSTKIKRTYSEDQRIRTTIIAPARGALPLATMISHRTGIKDIAVVNIRDVNEKKILDRRPKITYYNGMNLLIVDDIYDSGKTLRYLKGYYISLLEKNKIKKYSCNTASLIFRDLEVNGSPDFFGNKVLHNEWFNFPWEKK